MCQVPSLLEQCRTRIPEPITLTRRAAARRLGGGLLITMLMLLRSSPESRAQDAPSDGEAVFAGETYLAETRPGLFIAVIIGPDEAGTGNRPAQAFVCADEGLGQGFAGEVVGDALTLLPETREGEATPQPNSRLTGTLSAGRVTGEVVHGGQTVMFVAAPAAGGLVLGASSTGAHFLGETPMVPTETVEGRRYRIDGIVTQPDGTQRPLILNAAEPEAAVFHTVVLSDGRHCLIR